MLFNAITGAVALALLPWLVAELAQGAQRVGMGGDVAAVLALFHTTFNLLGVLLMWPLADRLALWLGARAHRNFKRPRKARRPGTTGPRRTRTGHLRDVCGGRIVAAVPIRTALPRHPRLVWPLSAASISGLTLVR